MSDDNKPIFIDPKKCPSPHMIIYDPVTDYRELEKFGGKCVKLGDGSTFDPCTEFTKLPDDMKDKLTAEAIIIIEKREAELDEFDTFLTEKLICPYCGAENYDEENEPEGDTVSYISEKKQE